MNYLDVGVVVLIHERMIAIGGGRPGVSDYRLVHSYTHLSGLKLPHLSILSAVFS